MATTLDEEFRKTMAEFAAGATVANERFSLTSVRIVATNIDADAEVWSLTAAEAEKRARKYRLVAAYALRGAALCDDHVSEMQAMVAEIPAP
jgi:radical SAM superfamily enzyme with C-terminal helix-hairpin-helix motif